MSICPCRSIPREVGLGTSRFGPTADGQDHSSLKLSVVLPFMSLLLMYVCMHVGRYRDQSLTSVSPGISPVWFRAARSFGGTRSTGTYPFAFDIFFVHPDWARCSTPNRSRNSTIRFTSQMAQSSTYRQVDPASFPLLSLLGMRTLLTWEMMPPRCCSGPELSTSCRLVANKLMLKRKSATIPTLVVPHRLA